MTVTIYRASYSLVKHETNSRGQLVLHLRQPFAGASPLRPQPWPSSVDVVENAPGHWEDLLLALFDEGLELSAVDTN